MLRTLRELVNLGCVGVAVQALSLVRLQVGGVPFRAPESAGGCGVG
jgi:hypothetical protein